MVAGARLAVEAGWEVRGSDNPLYPPTSHMVQALGVPTYTGYVASNLDWEPDIVVIGNVLSRGNPEVEAVLERQLHYVSLPEWLKDAVLRRRRPVVVCGTHGKTTTTALTAFLLDRAGINPGFLIGGQPVDFPHSARLGPEAAPFVIEGDEYDTAFFDKRAKFLHYLPQIALVTSVEFDHGDIYRDLAEIERAFQLMLRQISQSGWLVLCNDDAGAVALRDHAHCHVLTYGCGPAADFRGEHLGMDSRGQQFRILKRGHPWGEFITPLAGRHNLLNSLAALATADLLGVGPEPLAAALRDFRGVRRRMEVFLEADGVTFVDDFAHHPTAIRETVLAAKSRWPDRRLWVLFEPRSNTTVTNRFQEELIEALRSADEVWIGPLYRAEQVPPEMRLDRSTLTKALSDQNVVAHYSDDITEIVARVQRHTGSRDLVLILSNGAFGGIYDKLQAAFTPVR